MGKTIAVIGGDLRQLSTARLLSDDGYDVKLYGFGKDCMPLEYKYKNSLDELGDCEIIIFPMPATQDMKNVNAPFSNETISFESIKENLKNVKLILGGRMNKQLCDSFGGIKCIDYYQREDIKILNAVPTAEGAIEIAMSETARTINKTNCLVIGYGRIGKVLSKYLHSLGANVYVSCRKCEDMAWINVNGYNAIHNNCIKDYASKFDIIFNTAPAMILDEKILKLINPDCVIIDLASKPGGIDFEKASDFGLNVIWALSLPGKVAPLTSGKIIKDTIINIFNEEGV